MTYLSCAEPTANCDEDGQLRSLASHMWQQYAEPPQQIQTAGRAAAFHLSAREGKVESAGSLDKAEILQALRSVLPRAWTQDVRPRMEWYGCKGAFFHNDAHYAKVLFGVWSVAGPRREIVFPRAGIRAPAGPGNLVIFDPFEPHAVLRVGVCRYRREDFADSERSLFLGFELELSAAVKTAFGIREGNPNWPTLSSRNAVDPETGALTRSGA
jgi:hypothetical protein